MQAHPDYTGTLEEWLTSLKGEKGDKGDKGDSGRGILRTEISGTSLVVYYTDNTSETHDLSSIVSTTAVDYLTYTELDDGTYEVTLQEAYKDIVTSVIIPSQYKGKNVTSIGYSAFYNCKSLTNIIIPNGITSIGGIAFGLCDSLTNITIPNTVTSIGNSAFSKCTSLTNITIPSGVTNIESSTFSNCTSLTNITIPEGVTSIGYSAFYKCTSLSNITIPDTVTSIGNAAFRGCTKIIEVTIPESCISIENGAFLDTSLQNAYFEVSTGWKYYISYYYGDAWSGGTTTTTHTAIATSKVSDPVQAAKMLLDKTKYKYNSSMEAYYYPTYVRQ